MCGPTASGKTGLADTLADEASGEGERARTPTLVVDSMQVYKEIPHITNQERGRPAELVGITSVTEDWNMARHREAADKILERMDGTFVLDAGTGMYLNALIMDIDVSPKVSAQSRARAIEEVESEGSSNPRRDSRDRELEMSGHKKTGSIWSTSPRYDLSIIYIRPDFASLDHSIKQRSKKIAGAGLEEAEYLLELVRQGAHPNQSVSTSIGVRELMDVASGTIPIEEAETRISSRTRKLARRQIRWFDKLVETLGDSVNVRVRVLADATGEITSPGATLDIIGL